jgi:hypothetical protein
MSKPAILDEFPQQKHAGRPPEYPWDEWTDGEVRKLVRGEHFTCALRSLRSLIHLTARKRGLRAKTNIEERIEQTPDGPVKVEEMAVVFYEKK